MLGVIVMDKIILEKAIHFSTNIEQLYDVSVKDSIDYKLLDDGCSVVGVVKLSGIASSLKGMEPFDENIDVDIFAPFDQVIDQNKFSLSVEQYDFQILRNIVVFKICLKVTGFRKINEPNEPEIQGDENNIYNLTNEIDEVINDTMPLYDDTLIDEFNDTKITNQQNDLSSIDNEIKDDFNSENHVVEPVPISLHNEHDASLVIDKIIEESRTEPSPSTSTYHWANDLFKQKDSYVTFYKIHRKENDD